MSILSDFLKTVLAEGMGLTFASLTEVSRAPRSVALDRSLFEGPPDLLTTLSPSRVRVPNYSIK